MNLEQYRKLTDGRTPHAGALRERFMAAARQSRDQASRFYTSPLGTDCAEAPLYDHQADLFCLAADGADPDEAAAVIRTAWISYAKVVRQKVAEAPKIRIGPSSGNSCIGHRWVSGEAIERVIQHVRNCTQVWCSI